MRQMLVTRAMVIITLGLCGMASAQWNKQIIDQSGNAGYTPTIKVDLQGVPHVAYIKDGALYHGKWNGSSWNPVYVAGDSYAKCASIAHGIIGTTPVTALASLQGHSYVRQMSNGYQIWYETWYLLYAKIILSERSGPYTELSNLIYHSPTSPAMGLPWIEIVIAGDILHCVYFYYGQPLHIQYNLRTKQWLESPSIDNVVTGAAVKCSLTADASGNLHLSYFDQADWDLKYAYYNGTAWNSQYIDTGNVGEWNSIVIRNGKPHIFYNCYDDTWTTSSLKHAEMN